MARKLRLYRWWNLLEEFVYVIKMLQVFERIYTFNFHLDLIYAAVRFALMPQQLSSILLISTP